MRTAMVEVEVYTGDSEWIAQNGYSHSADGERVTIPGCRAVGEFTFRGRRWINYLLPAGVSAPRDWDKVAPGTTAAPAEWVH